jgi:hypothetical protein
MPDNTESPVLEALTKAYVDGWTDALHNGATGLYMHADVVRHVMDTALSDPAVVYELPLVKPLIDVVRLLDHYWSIDEYDAEDARDLAHADRNLAHVDAERDLYDALVKVRPSVRDYIGGQS